MPNEKTGLTYENNYFIVSTTRFRPITTPVNSDVKRHESGPQPPLGGCFILRIHMHLCYVDESGDSQAINNATHSVQPLLVLAGLFIDAQHVAKLTSDFAALKRKYYPTLLAGITHQLSVLLHEVKGAEMRTAIRDNPIGSGVLTHHFHFLDEVLALLSKYDVKLVARIWLKQFGCAIKDQSVYSISIQQFCARFQEYLELTNKKGMVVADFRDPKKNSYVSHSVFTQKHKMSGDAYPRIQEIPTFGISNNHACLQLADLICSVLLAPMAARKFLSPVVSNVHTHAHYDEILRRYRKRVRALQFHCDVNGVRHWGISLDNPHGTGNYLFS